MNEMRTLAVRALLAFAALASAGEAEIVYDNTSNPVAALGDMNGAEWADDLHLTRAGRVTRIRFGYVANGSTQATIRIFPNNATNSYYPNPVYQYLNVVVPLPAGTPSGVQVLDLPTPVEIPQHIWMSIQFDDFNGKVQLATPATVGWSDVATTVLPAAPWFPADWGGNFLCSVEFEDPQPKWIDLGNALGGSAGVPKLEAFASLMAGTSVEFQLTDAQLGPWAAYLVVGTSQANLPFLGGTLVPTPTVMLLPIHGFGGYTVEIEAITPAGVPSGVPIVAQFWIVSTFGPVEYTASNAVTWTTP